LRRLTSLLVILVALALLVVVPGCGGGGGLILGSLQFVVQWAGDGPNGETPGSVRVTLYRGTQQVAQGVIPRTGPADAGEFGSLAAATYRVTAEAFTSSDGSGVAFAAVDTLQQVTGGLPTMFVSAVGPTPTSVSLAPTTATVRVGETVRLYAVAKDATGSAVYTAPGSFEWSSENEEVAVVDAGGLVRGMSTGTTTITARHGPTDLSAQAGVTVSGGTRTKYTILVFLNAANDLDTFSDLNVNQMELAASNPQVRIVVQWKRIGQFSPPWTGTRRYLIAHDTNSSVVNSQLLEEMGPNVDMGDWRTLRDFVDWGMSSYPADHTVLVMWDHGSGWRTRAAGGSRGVSFDDGTGNYIKTWELAQALEATPKIDILAWDASLMQMLEVAYEVKDVVNYIVGSEESPPGPGYPYDAIIARLAANHNMTPRDFTKVFVEEMIRAYGSNSNITQSSLDASKIGALGTAVSALADVLIAKRPFYPIQMQNARQSAESYSYYPEYKDLSDVCSQLAQKTGDNEIANACAVVQAAVSAAVVAEASGSLHPRSHGVSINYPSAAQFSTQRSAYSLLAFARLTSWDEWLLVAP